MKAQNEHNHPMRYWPFYLTALLAVAALLLVQPFQTAGASASATYSHGVMYVTIPYHAPQSGAGKLIIEVLNPEDQVLGRAEQHVDISSGKGHWQQEIKLDNPLPLDEVVWNRVRYRFEYSGQNLDAIEGTDSISEILRTPVVHVLAQQTYLSGGEAAVRVIVTDTKNELIAGGGSVRIELVVPDQKSRALYKGHLNKRGTTEAQFQFPAGLVGSYQLHYVVDTPIGSTEFSQAVKLDDKVSILLTTEKPIYQPGQTIHVRALALDRANHEAAANRKLTFEVEDSRGNKVFKKITETDKFGVASTDFGLADEVNLGTYHLRALLGEADAPTNTAEVALNVEKYVLPKFKVAIEFGDKNNKTKHGYRPGDHVTGTVRANYFFGKSVEGEVTVKASSMDVSVFEAATVHGKTDPDGTYHFDITLPSYFAGRPLSQGAARVLIEATVKDSASHSETRGEPITVSESPLLLTAIPEGGTLVPNLENQVFILASYPDGSPASADLNIHAANNPDRHAVTDNGGIAEVAITAGTGIESLQIEAIDKERNHASSTVQLQTREGDDQILLRTEHAVYHAGDRMDLKVFSTVKRGTAYIDVVKEGQTILTRDIDIENGRAELTLTASPDMAGTLDFNAYLFGHNAQPVGDHRLVFVQPADELKIETTTDSAVYKPGDEARINFRVTNSRGEGVSAALGLQVVDEAVFALAEKQPGFAKVFFYLEQEVMKPRYEIHSIGMPEAVEPVEESKAEQHDRAARALFSATEVVNTNKFENEFGRSVPQEKLAVYSERYQKRFMEQMRRLSETISRTNGQEPDINVVKIVEKMEHAGDAGVRDAWGNPLRVQTNGSNGEITYFLLTSAGPDKQFNTADDIGAYLQVHHRKIAGHPSSGENLIDSNIEHDRGPYNGRAEITGTAVDQWGAVLEGATITATETSNGKKRVARVSASGSFRFSSLPPGDYHIEAASATETVASDLTLAARDRANLSVYLRKEPGGPVVSVYDWNGTGGILANFGRGRGCPNCVMADDRAAAGGFAQREMMVPAPMAAMTKALEVNGNAPLLQTDTAAVNTVLDGEKHKTTGEDKKDTAGANTHVRSYFPEALYINPEIITDKDGRASISIPMADSITTWRMAMMASTQHGALGSSTSSIKVFQDFFVDLDLPVTLTQGDRVSIPVAIYNYSGGKGDVSLKLQADDWYALIDDAADKNVSVDSGRVGGSQFTVQANRIGKFKLTLSAQMKGSADRADIVVREIEIIPNGREQNTVSNGRLETTVQQQVDFPSASIPDASKIFVRLYPGPMSQVVEGMDAILRMPGGCFEQTSSSTYPNVLALDYMKRSKKLAPEVHAKAEGYIANGYQRLLTFEVQGGGFSWFGQAPANKILTAYGLMEFYDMSKVHDVDEKLISRTQQWLASQQQEDGSWKPDTYFINEGATNRYNTDVVRITAYIAWSLKNTGYQGPAVERALQYLQKHMSSGKLDSYTLAVLANFAVDYGKDRAFTNQTMKMLLDARTEKDEQAWWSADETSVYATGTSASVETTGLAIQALLKWGEASGTARKALSYIASKKDAYGTWGSTQATIMALRALLLATEKGSADVRGTVEVLLNGKPVEKIVLTPENNDLLHQFVFKGKDINLRNSPRESDDTEKTIGPGKFTNNIEIRFEGKGGLAYQIVGQYFLPWDKQPEGEALSISVDYDRTHLAQDDIATATATIKNNLNKSANMVMVDLGIPPGFDLLSEDLQTYQEKSASLKNGKLEKFSQTATQAILYFNAFAPRETVTVHFRLRAKYPIRAHTFQSRVYEYYDPDVSSMARPVQLEVKQK